MIKYNLKCKNNHEFESWFASSSEYEKLKKKGLLECIFCNTKKIDKSIMSPRILNSKLSTNYNNHDKSDIKKLKKELLNIRKFVEKNFTYVGNKFASKIKDIYYDKKDNKKIYGTTTQKERDELEEEGIKLTSIPWIDKEN
ncbi:MAG: DUF1178 family protein [Pelagibacteraceae bacterium]